jgi:hypothetical protein
MNLATQSRPHNLAVLTVAKPALDIDTQRLIALVTRHGTTEDSFHRQRLLYEENQTNLLIGNATNQFPFPLDRLNACDRLPQLPNITRRIVALRRRLKPDTKQRLLSFTQFVPQLLI